MRARIATIALMLLALTGPAAQAGPAEVNVRIEGRTETLFEGPILTEGHDIEASSDIQERSCNGINPNDPQNVTPASTPTAASVDAMSLIGETFDGRWYPGYDDYFITRWGPDSEAEGVSWGVLVNNVYTSVGGCQYQLSTGAEVLWVYDAFASRPLLALLPAAAGYTSGARPLTATGKLDKPFEVEVLAYTNQGEAAPPAAPERTGSSPYEGADVSPVQTSAKGFEVLQTASAETVRTNAQGKASIIFTTPGWHRIKATAVNAGGEEDAVRSNRLDVCVPAEGATGCGEPPAEDLRRTPPRDAEEATETRQETEATTTVGGNSGGEQPSPTGPGATTTSTGHTASGPIARVVLESISPMRLLLKFTAAGKATVRLARLLRKGHHRHWRAVRTIAVTASQAGPVEVKLPRLAVGRYRLSIALAGGQIMVRTLIVGRKWHLLTHT
jgi:hypothetical protein